MKTQRARLFLALVLALLLGSCASVTLAHPLHGATGADGLLHPFGGADHVLGMLGVGLWAALQVGRTRWLVPAGFIGAMALAAWVGAWAGASLLVEAGILASLLLTGVLVVFCIRTPALPGILVAGSFAALHGHAHGVDMMHAGDAWAFWSGFLLTTLLLLGTGLLAGLRLKAERTLVRACGAGLALCGGLLALRALA